MIANPVRGRLNALFFRLMDRYVHRRWAPEGRAVHRPARRGRRAGPRHQICATTAVAPGRSGSNPSRMHSSAGTPRPAAV